MVINAKAMCSYSIIFQNLDPLTFNYHNRFPIILNNSDFLEIDHIIQSKIMNKITILSFNLIFVFKGIPY